MKKQLLIICLFTALILSDFVIPNHLTNGFSVIWLVSNVLNGVVLFTVLQLYLLILEAHSFTKNLLWITALTAIAYMLEYLQGIHIIKGIFDILDIIAYESAYAIALILALRTHLDNLFADCEKQVF